MSFPSAQSPDVSANLCSLRALSLQNQPFFGKTVCPNCRNKCPSVVQLGGDKAQGQELKDPLGAWAVACDLHITRRVFWVGNKAHHGTTMLFFFFQCSWQALARCLPSATSDGRPEKDARGPSPGARRRCSPGTGEDGGGRGQAPRPRAAWEAWTPAPRLLWTHPQKGQGVTGSRILPVTVAGNTVGGLYLYWTQEEPGVGWLGSFFAHFLHPRAIC